MLNPLLGDANTPALRDVVAERLRQIERGHTRTLDDRLGYRELARAAGAHLLHLTGDTTRAIRMYPFRRTDRFTHRTTREHLVRAAALIIAEIERYDAAMERAP